MTQAKKRAIICDIDMTLADCRHRIHWIEPWKRPTVTHGVPPANRNAGVMFLRDYDTVTGEIVVPDWERFYSEMDKDTVIEAVEHIVCRLHLVGLEILFITGRPEKYRQQTLDWLFKAGIPLKHGGKKLLMRPDFLPCSEAQMFNSGVCTHEPQDRTLDHRPAHEVKREIYLRDIQPHYDVLFVLEDDDESISMYREFGLTCLKVMV